MTKPQTPTEINIATLLLDESKARIDGARIALDEAIQRLTALGHVEAARALAPLVRDWQARTPDDTGDEL